MPQTWRSSPLHPRANLAALRGLQTKLKPRELLKAEQRTVAKILGDSRLQKERKGWRHVRRARRSQSAEHFALQEVQIVLVEIA
jgi:hypothetical protein